MDDKPDLRSTLIRAAVAMLDASAEISLRSVARAASVSAMAPYRHFADKAALMGAVAEWGFAALRDALAAADQSAAGSAALVAQGLAYIQFAQARPHLFRLMFSGPSVASTDKRAGDGAFGVLADQVAALAGGPSPPRTIGCWAVVHGLAILQLDRRLELDLSQCEAVLSQFLRAE